MGDGKILLGIGIGWTAAWILHLLFTSRAARELHRVLRRLVGRSL
jgi:hypothetical protein